MYKLLRFSGSVEHDPAVAKWFDADVDLTDDQRRKKAQGFIAESRNITDLRSNPLMLALLCNIYRGEGHIPRNRPAVCGSSACAVRKLRKAAPCEMPTAVCQAS